MASISDLISQIQKHYDIVKLEEKGTTAGGKIYEYDLWYKDGDIVRYKRLHIFRGEDGSYWYSENPIPRASPSATKWADALREKAEEELMKHEDIVFWNVLNIDEAHKRAILEVWVDDGTSLKTKKVFIGQKSDNTWNVRIRD